MRGRSTTGRYKPHKQINKRRRKGERRVGLQWLYSGSTVGLQWLKDEQKTNLYRG
ncbi:hypothetical protein [Capnocytophaga ochracea]|uniref:hypothetical protein n=1 Tax=Capnocytophaga ochracea TaxID=1018 RepID=UPI0015EB4C47|nr:hypothetical protein [Capnocytophaga ochracea]